MQPELLVVATGVELVMLVVRADVVEVAKVVEVCGTRTEELVVEEVVLTELVVPMLPPGAGAPTRGVSTGEK